MFASGRKAFITSMKRRVATHASRPFMRTWTLQSRNKHTLVLMRHGQSAWNLENRFTGWVDIALTDQGMEEARRAGDKLKEAGFEFDLAFTSTLKRAIKTLWITLETIDQMWLPVVKDYRLNERHYGALTGLNKAETASKHGDEQVLIWRRSYDIPPPALDRKHEHWPGNDRRYKTIDPAVLPITESLETTAQRVLPYWNSTIVPKIKAGERVLIVAHGNSLRALVKELDGLSNEEIVGINIPTGVPLVYELDDNLKPIPAADAAPGLSAKYLEH